MRITWYGHAAFLIEAQGLRLILDPYRSPDSGGYDPIDDSADLVVVSHDNDVYHSHLGQIREPYEVVRGLEIPSGEFRVVQGLSIGSVHVYESPERKADEVVSIVHFRAEGIHLAFLGDLGHELTDAEVDSILEAEVVLIPAGGPPTIDFDLIPGLIGQIRPRLIVPMHYLTPKINLKIQPIDRFLAALPDIETERVDGSTWELEAAGALPEQPRILLLDHAR